ncbi:hypothetical protein PMAYCL1PPCAC_09614, partial [Pristionchus mayeri]
LREMYHSIVTVAREGNIDELLIPLIHPECLTIDESIIIGLHGISEQCKQNCDVQFVNQDAQIGEIYEKCIATFNQSPSNLSPFDFAAVSLIMKAQKIIGPFPPPPACGSSAYDYMDSEHQKNAVFSIGVSPKDTYPKADCISIVVDRKLRYKGKSSIVDTITNHLRPPIVGRTNYDDRFVFTSPTQSSNFNSTICIVLEELPRSIRYNHIELQNAYFCMYNAIMRGAAMHNFNSAVIPILSVSGVKTDASIALAIHFLIMLQHQNGVHNVTLYHDEPKVISRIFYMLGNRCIRHFPSCNYRNTIIGFLSEIPCSNTSIRKLPAMIRIMWNAVPHLIQEIPFRPETVDVNVVTTSGFGQRTTISIVCANIATVPAPNGATVNAANGILQFGDGVTGVLGRAAGAAAARECNDLIARYRSLGIARLPAGSATITGCGNMKTIATRMIHAVGPIVKQGHQPSDEDVYRLKSTYDQVFRLAGMFNLESLVIPFICTGIYGFPSDLGMIIALYAALNSLPAHNIKEVVFVHNYSRTVRSFTALMGGQRELI